MAVVKQIHIKNRTYYFYNDIIDLKKFRYQKLTKNHTKTLVFTTLDTWQRKKIDDCEKIYSVSPLYLIISHANGYIKEKGVNKYLVIDSTDKNKELLKKYNDVFNGIKDKIKEASSDECDYEKDYTKIKFKQTVKFSFNDHNYKACFWRRW